MKHASAGIWPSLLPYLEFVVIFQIGILAGAIREIVLPPVPNRGDRDTSGLIFFFYGITAWGMYQLVTIIASWVTS